MGRNRMYKDGRTQVALYLSPEELQAFEEIRWRERKERSQLARQAIVEYIKNHASGNSVFKLDKWNEDPTFQAIPTYHSDKEKWIEHYKTSNPEERTRLRIQAMNFNKWFRMVDTNK